MPYATRSKGPAAQGYLYDADGALVVISPSANGKGTHMKWIREDAGDRTPPTRRRRTQAAAPVRPLTPPPLSSPNTPPQSSPARDMPKTPPRTSFYSAGSVVRTPKAKRLVRSPAAIGRNDLRVWCTPDPEGGVEQLIINAAQRGHGRVRMEREVEQIRMEVARRREEEEERIYLEQWKKLCAERDARMVDFALLEEEDIEDGECEMKLEDSDMDSVAPTEILDSQWFASFGENAAPAVGTAHTNALSSSSSGSFVPAKTTLSRQATEIINSPSVGWTSFGESHSSAPANLNWCSSLKENWDPSSTAKTQQSGSSEKRGVGLIPRAFSREATLLLDGN